MKSQRFIIKKECDLEYPKSKMFYGLVIVIELADLFYEDGCSLTVLSEKYGFVLSRLRPIVHRLTADGIIARHPDNDDWIYLVEEPDNLWILKIVPLLKISLRE